MALRAVRNCLVVGILVVLPGSLRASGKPSAEFAEIVLRLIGHSDREFRAAGLEQVRTAARGADFTHLVAGQLAKLAPDAQIALLNALADRGDHAARSAVLNLLISTHDETVRVAAIGALGRLGEPADLPLLIKLLTCESRSDQAAAHRSLIEMPGEAVSKALASGFRSKTSAEKSAILDVLAARRAGDQAPLFLAAIVDDNALVRSAGMTALGQLAHPDQIAAMLAGVLKAEKGHERDEAEMNVARVCARIESADRRGEALIAALQTVDPAHQDELLSLLGRVGGSRLIDFVVAIATGQDGVRRQLGIDALSKWPDASPADKLLDIVNRASDSDERRQAFRGFVKVSALRDGRSDKERLGRLKQAMTVAKTRDEVALVITRVRTAYDIDSLRFLLPYVDQPDTAQIACETIVEIAHHREVRDPHKAEFAKALDKVIATSKDPVVIDRASRYKRGETWQRPPRQRPR